MRRCSRRRSRRRSGTRTPISFVCPGFCGRARWCATWSSCGSGSGSARRRRAGTCGRGGSARRSPLGGRSSRTPSGRPVAGRALPRDPEAHPPRERPDPVVRRDGACAPTTPRGGRGAPVGQTPIVEGTGQRFGANVDLGDLQSGPPPVHGLQASDSSPRCSSSSSPGSSVRPRAEDDPDPRRSPRAPRRRGPPLGRSHTPSRSSSCSSPATARSSTRPSYSTRTSRPTQSADAARAARTS